MPEIIIDTDELLNTTDAAEQIGVGYATLYRMIKRGDIIPIKLAGRTLIPRSEVERLRKDQ